MNVHCLTRLAITCTWMASAVFCCPVVLAQPLFVGNYNDVDNQPFDGQHPVQQYNGATGAYQGSIAFPGRPTGLTMAPDGSIYATNFTDIPPGSSTRPPDTIERYDGATGAFVQVADLGVADPYGLTVTASGDVYVAAKYYTVNGTSQGTVLKYDAGSKQVTSVALVNDPYDVAFDNNGNLYVTAHQYTNAAGVGYFGAVLRYNTTTQAFDFFASVPEPTGLAFRNGVLYVSSYNYDDVWRFDTQTGAGLSTYASQSKVNGGPEGLAFDADGNLYTATHAGDVRKYDPATDTFKIFAGDPSHPLVDPFGLAFSGAGSNMSAAPEPPAVAAPAFTGLILIGGLLRARRPSSRSVVSTNRENHA